MIAAFSTSSPLASTALFTTDGELLGSREDSGSPRAGEACLRALEELLAEHRLDTDHLTGTLADLGPGSFTGTRVAVAIAKTLAWSKTIRCGGLSSFDLLGARGDELRIIPTRPNTFFVMDSAGNLLVDQPLPDQEWIGYGSQHHSATFPRAKNFHLLWPKIDWTDAVHLLPRYLLPPSISAPKKPYGTGFHA